MPKKTYLENIRSDAAECLLLSSIVASDKKELFAAVAEHLKNLAFDIEKAAPIGGADMAAAQSFRLENIETDAAMFVKLAKQLTTLASDIEKTKAVEGADVSSFEPPELERVRSDAAEYLELRNLASGDNKDMFAKVADYQQRLVVQIEKTTAANDMDTVSAEKPQLEKMRSDAAMFAKIAEHLNDLISEIGKTATAASTIVAPSQQSAAPAATDELAVGNFANIAHLRQPRISHRARAWLFAVAAVSIIAGLFWANNRVGNETSLSGLQAKRERSLVPDSSRQAGLLPGKQVAVNNQTPDAEQRIGTLTMNLDSARRDLEAKTALLVTSADEIVQLKKSAEAATTELNEAHQRTVALTDDLTSTHRQLELNAALLRRASEEKTQLIDIAAAATAELQQQRQLVSSPDQGVSLALKSSLAPPTSERPVVAGNKVDAEAAHLMAQAKSLLSQGSIGAARSILERAIKIGSANASFAIAETYDPRVLSHWNRFGTQGDVSKARKFYEKAAVGGVAAAKDRLISLN